MKNRIIVAITGASGAIYAKVLLDKLSAMSGAYDSIGLLMSTNAKTVWMHELGNDSYKDYPFRTYEKHDFDAPFASGSAKYNIMIVCPCSMGTMGRIASGVSDDLLTRAADVILKEKRKLILVVRETPYNLVHIRNMESLLLAGAVICPATPSFYSKPANFEQLAATVVDRVLDLSDLDVESFRWGT